MTTKVTHGHRYLLQNKYLIPASVKMSRYATFMKIIMTSLRSVSHQKRHTRVLWQVFFSASGVHTCICVCDCISHCLHEKQTFSNTVYTSGQRLWQVNHTFNYRKSLSFDSPGLWLVRELLSKHVPFSEVNIESDEKKRGSLLFRSIITANQWSIPFSVALENNLNRKKGYDLTSMTKA